MNGIVLGVICVAGIALYVGTLHLIFYLRSRDRRENLSFAIACFAIVLYDIFCAGLYSSVSVEQGAGWQQWQAIALAGLGIALLRFVVDFTNRRFGFIPHLFTVYWAIQSLVTLVDQWNITWSNRPSIKPLGAFGRTWQVCYEVEPAILMNVQSAVGLLAGAYMVYLLVSRYQEGHPRGTRSLIAGMGVLVAAVVNDTAVSSGTYEFFYLIEYAFVVLALAMASALGSVQGETRAALRLSRDELNRLAAAVNESAESIIITDAAGTMLYVNPAFERMTGYSRDEVVGRNPGILSSGQHDKEFYSHLWSTISTGRVWRGVFKNRKKDGTLFEEDAVISPIRGPDGAITSYVAVKRDISHELALQNQLRHSQKMQAVGQLAGKVAHDFTNILSALFAHAQILRKNPQLPPDVPSHLDEMLAAIRRASAITQELLVFSRKQPILLRVEDLNRIVRNAEALLNVTRTSGIHLTINPQSDPLRVNMDRAQIEQVLVQMSINACDVMPRGGSLTMETTSATLRGAEKLQLHRGAEVHKDTPESFAVLHISDTGSGISDDVLPHIFEPFFTTKGSTSHTGLGLSTAYGIVHQHNGSISVYTVPGLGTSFSIFLPLVEPPEEPVEPFPVPAGPPRKILLVVRDTLMRGLLDRILQDLGFMVQETGTCAQVVDLLTQKDAGIEYVCSDVVLARENTPDRCETIQKLAKVMFVSGFPVHHAKALGIVRDGPPLVCAPFNRRKIITALKALSARTNT